MTEPVDCFQIIEVSLSTIKDHVEVMRRRQEEFAEIRNRLMLRNGSVGLDLEDTRKQRDEAIAKRAALVTALLGYLETLTVDPRVSICPESILNILKQHCLEAEAETIDRLIRLVKESKAEAGKFFYLLP